MSPAGLLTLRIPKGVVMTVSIVVSRLDCRAVATIHDAGSVASSARIRARAVYSKAI